MIKELLSLLPPIAIYNIIRRSIDRERDSRMQIESVTIDWQPDDTYTPRVNANGVTEYYKVIREAKK